MHTQPPTQNVSDKLAKYGVLHPTPCKRTHLLPEVLFNLELLGKSESWVSHASAALSLKRKRVLEKHLLKWAVLELESLPVPLALGCDVTTCAAAQGSADRSPPPGSHLTWQRCNGNHLKQLIQTMAYPGYPPAGGAGYPPPPGAVSWYLT